MVKALDAKSPAVGPSKSEARHHSSLDIDNKARQLKKAKVRRKDMFAAGC
jgi:hypothetical protein